MFLRAPVVRAHTRAHTHTHTHTHQCSSNCYLQRQLRSRKSATRAVRGVKREFCQLRINDVTLRPCNCLVQKDRFRLTSPEETTHERAASLRPQARTSHGESMRKRPEPRTVKHMLVSRPYSRVSDINLTLHRAFIRSVMSCTCPNLGLAPTKQGYLQYWRHPKAMFMQLLTL
jgi:hypothetical protein